MIPPLVYIEWEDAHEMDVEPGWNYDLDHTYRPLIVSQAGYLLSDTPEGFIITSSWTPDFTGPRTAIPRAMVVKICPLNTQQPAYLREGAEHA